MSEAAVNGDLGVRVHVETASMAWEASPAGGVERKRLHRVGPAEAGEVTSLVRYLPGASFPRHPHPRGEEILVLEGTFADEHGEWPARTFLANPEGVAHAPRTREGCLLFVKLRQYPGGRPRLALDVDRVPEAGDERAGIRRRWLFRSPAFPERIAIERWTMGARRAALGDPGGVELFVLEGALEVDGARLGRHGWLRLPAGEVADVACVEAAEVYVKSGALPLLASA